MILTTMQFIVNVIIVSCLLFVVLLGLGYSLRQTSETT